MTKDKSPDTWPNLPLMRNEKVIEAPPDRDYLAKRTTDEVIAFLERHRGGPFFAYVPHTMPGSTPRPFSSPTFRGKSRNGDYGDSVEELDWSTGQILTALQRLGLDENTLVIRTFLRNRDGENLKVFDLTGEDLSSHFEYAVAETTPGRIGIAGI